MSSIELLPDFGSAYSVVRYFAAVGVQAFVFLIALAVLGRLIFAPAVKILNLRKKIIDEVENETLDFLEKNEVLAEEYRWRMDGASQLAEERREIARLMGRRRAEMILSDARKETGRDLDNVVKSAESACAVVLMTAKKDIAAFAEGIVDKILE